MNEYSNNLDSLTQRFAKIVRTANEDLLMLYLDVVKEEKGSEGANKELCKEVREIMKEFYENIKKAYSGALDVRSPFYESKKETAT